MKLYYYILDSDKKSKPILKSTEREVKMENGIYRATDKGLPFGSYAVNPKEIGELQVSRWGREISYVVFLEPDANTAKRLFVEYVNKKIEACKERISALEEKRKIIESTENMKEW